MIATLFAGFTVGFALSQIVRVRVIHAMFPEGPFFWLGHGPLFYGIEFRVSRKRWCAIGYTPEDLRKRGW